MKTRHKIVALFSGQGSHYRGMGKGLFHSNKTFRREMEFADEYVYKLTGRSVIDELYHSDEKGEWDDLLMTHPAIISVENAVFQMIKEEGVQPDYFLGNSLGEYSAAIAAEQIDLQTGLEICIEQAKLLLKYQIEGGMTAVIDAKQLRESKKYEQFNLSIASDNFEGHFTVSGLRSDLGNFENELRTNGIQYVRLNVAYPFHSAHIEKIKGEFLTFLSYYSFKNGQDSAFLSCISNKEITKITAEYFWEVTRGYSNLKDVISALEKNMSYTYLDLGPSGTMATFVKYNLMASSSSKTYAIMTPYHRDLLNFNTFKQELLAR